ncbi:uncharacterized protein LOC128669719 [Plodia interpunctella]|uniref:uncharacterized protein LOC128669719 n=1 Tax=Plodia interpunctella TaxID=58824 RepID=UPI0023683F66|nr:uncharacterized protein LOC128669719 [Plodia interpunctella]
MSSNKDHDDNKGDTKVPSAIGAEESMNTLILWNISKALQRNPSLDLKTAIRSAHDRLDNTRDVNKIITQSPEERHLACALLAWQELGHSTADSLYRFIENKLGDHERRASETLTQNAKIRILSPTDESETLDSHQTKTSKDQECSNKQKCNKESKPVLEKCAHCNKEPKSNSGKSEISPHSKGININCKESHPSRAKCIRKIESSKSTTINCNEACCRNNAHATASNICVLNNTKNNNPERLRATKCPFMTSGCNPIYKYTNVDNCINRDSCTHFDTDSLKGPVVTLPPDTKVVMRLDNASPCDRHRGKKPRAGEKDIMSKIDAACCMDSACAERLAELDKATTELRNRAGRLARREAERAELLERAEAAWKDLELGYQRRLRLAEEKEFDIGKQTKKLIEERNSYKTACMNLAKVLKERGDATEKDRQSLVQVEKEMCSLACMRMRLSEEAARSEAGLTEQQIKVTQLDRDLQFKEEQTRRKLIGIQGEAESVRALTIEAERAMRAELAALRDQVEAVSKQLLKEDNESIKIKAELESIRSEKSGLVEDLEGCQVTCDSRLQKKMDELKKAREKLTQLKEKVMECKCVIPIDASVEVKRTPSLAALCSCTPEDKLLESCSCTSLRSQLLSNLLSDLFGGLQAELGDVAAQMPCQYLKCLEDKHNWDKASLVKSNLRSYFSKLLIGELDIAIATAIENYHAKWVGISCVDTMRAIPDTDTMNNEGWQERAIERRAQKLANRLAEQLFEERADELVQRAKDVVKSGPPPCECKETAVFPCLIKPPTVVSGGFAESGGAMSTYWRKTCKDVTQLRIEIEDLKKESLKKEDLKVMEEKIFKLVQRPSSECALPISKEAKLKILTNNNTDNIKITKLHDQSVNTETPSKCPAQVSKPIAVRKRNVDVNHITKKSPKKVLNEQSDRTNRNFKKCGPLQTFAVNTCFCGNQNMMPKIINESNTENECKSIRKQTFSKTSHNQISNSKQSKPISGEIEAMVMKNKILPSCKSGCVCFHKIPSNTSLDKLLEKLTKWTCDLDETTQIPGDSNIQSNLNTQFSRENNCKLIANSLDISNKLDLGGKSNIIYQASTAKTPEEIISQNISTYLNTPILPNAIESEYLGTINLDKSNDHCQCMVKQKLNKKGAKTQEPSSLFRCIDSEFCECKKPLDIYGEKSNLNSKKSESAIKNVHTSEMSENKTKKGDLKVRDEINHQSVTEKVIHDEIVTDANKTDTAINQIVKTSELFPCDCDYYVKLLGVTLANINSQKVFDNKHSMSHRKKKSEILSNDDNVEMTRNYPNKTNGQKGDLNLQSCQCHVHFDQFKNYMENNFRKPWGDHSTNDKELDVPSFKEISSNNNESCICCNKGTLNESQELEVNTFYLLEEHLRGKLEKLKKSCCKVSSLPVEEEEKVFSSILQRVKQVISTSANELICKCKEEKLSDGSWNRANTLLQEYLKTKIKKVQCLCANEDQKQECVLPKVLDEIYSLIEKDFQRLKNFYNFQKANDNTIIPNENSNKDEKPEKDTNNYNTIIDSHELLIHSKLEKNNRISHSNSKNSMKPKNSMSTQAFFNFQMNSKSCDAIEKETKNIQTSESDVKGFNMKKNENCDCSSLKEFLISDTQNVSNHFHKTNNVVKKMSSPYIGYTVDCSCKCALGTCTCIKSTVVRNNDEINNLWKDLIKDNQSKVKYSYIMKSPPDKRANQSVYNSGVEHLVKNTNKNQISKNTECELNDEEIVLKDLKRHVIVSNNSANTCDSNINIKDIIINSEERDEVCECRVIKPILKTTIRSDSQLSNTMNMHKTQSLSCDCNMVPICHVKMLVDSIENRIYHSKCTCDSFSARVCPIHSKKVILLLNEKMDPTKDKKNKKYKTYANGTEKKRNRPNIFSRIFLWWVCPVLIKGNKRDVEEDDLIVPTKQYDSQKLGDDFEKYWTDELKRAELENRKPSLWKAIVRAYWVAYLPSGVFVFISAIARTYQPQVFTQLLSYWSVDSEMDPLDAGLYALAILGLNFVGVMCQHHNSLFVMRFSLRIKIACSALLYRKVLRMNQVALGEVAGGKLVNLLSNDVARFDYAFMFLHNMWVIPIQTAVILYLLYVAAGYAPFVGLGVALILILPLQFFLTKFTFIVRRQVAKRTDRRIKLMNEIINGIQVIKMYAWEIPFQLVVKAVREYEMQALKRSLFIRSSFIGFMLFTERSIMLFTIITLVFAGSMISATVIYPIQQYFSTIQFNVTMILPMAIASLSEMLVSIERIQDFLVLGEVSDNVAKKNNGSYADNLTFNSKHEPTGKSNVLANKITSLDNLEIVAAPAKPVNSDFAVEISDVNASWIEDASPEDATLKNLSFRVRHKKLCAIIGPVGSGKTSVLQLLLRELPTRTGSVKVNGTISYASQEPWLFSGTVRENILFGLPYDVEKYKEVARVCSLQPDFKQFPYGDLSLVGDRGVSLSGGQRARINLARAVYRDSDIYLLDDPLSAVDANVGRQLFEICIKGYLAKKTCILVTHQIHYLKAAEQLIILNDGTIENMGTYDDLVKSEKEFSMLLASLQEGDVEDGGADKGVKRPSLHRGVSVKSEDGREEKQQVLEAEERAKGNLKWEVIFSYISSVQSWFFVMIAVCTLIVTQAAATTADYWISFWTNSVDNYINDLPEDVDPDPGWNTEIGILTTAGFVYVLSGVVVSLIILTQLRIVTFVSATIRASQNLHNSVFKNIINAVMRFFDTNPSGRILNRFSKDLGAVDELLPRSLLETLQSYLYMISVLTLNAIALPWTLLPTSILIILFVVMLKWYLNAAQAVKRLEGTTKSPVFGMINSTLSGLSTIRSSNSETRLLRQFDNAQDIHSSAFYTFLGGSTAFGLYLDVLCLVYLGIIMCIFLFIEFGDSIPVGSAGLAVSQSMALIMMLQMSARFTADFLGQMTSVERVLEYKRLPQEANMDEGPIQPPSQWPMKGEIVFKDVSMRYGPQDPPVLKNLNFVLNATWKVGVVGRTGAGKSSLISALFRLTETEGSIMIDGLDTQEISKKELRSRISIIPQEPVLFSATLRYNLDPFNSYSDDEIWRALEQVELKDAVPALDYKVSEGGTNFSVGQRQLICLARAVLRSNKILVMDEATANVDPQTDALIQKTIRREFASCTVLTIAHRLNTIMDSDRVLVMDKGQAVEFDYPYRLLSNPDSIFSFMVRETGDNMSKVLHEIAKTKYFRDNPAER